MDLVSSCAVAASILGLSSGHPFVFLGRMIQETCLKVGDATDGEVLLAVTVTRVGGSGELLLFGSGYVDGERSADPLPHADALVSIGVDSIAHALRQVHTERRLADEPRRPLPSPRQPPSTAQPEKAVDGLKLGATLGADVEEDPNNHGVKTAVTFGSGNHEDGDVAAEGTTEFVAGGMTQPILANAGVDEAVAGDPGVTSELPGDRGCAENGAAAAANAADGSGGHRRDAEDEDAQSRGARRTTLSAVSDSRFLSAALLSPSLYKLPDDLQLPGLMVAPKRILLRRGRGRTRTEPPPAEKRSVDIPETLVQETIRELMPTPAYKSLLLPLVSFSQLCKFAVDTLVKRQTDDPNKRDAVDHSFLQLTPEAARGATVNFKNHKGTRVAVESPVFTNSTYAKIDPFLAIILLQKHERDPFFLWLMGIFARGARAPTDKSFLSDGPPVPAGTRRRGHKRPRGSPKKDADENIESPDAGRELGARMGDEGSDMNAIDGVGVVGRVDIAAHLVARHVLHDRKVVASATLHPDMDMFHGKPTPLNVVPGYITAVADGCGNVPYPFGQDSALCLEHGNPSSTPVPLSSVGNAYRIAWLAGSVGYVVRLVCGVRDVGEVRLTRVGGVRMVRLQGSVWLMPSTTSYCFLSLHVCLLAPRYADRESIYLIGCRMKAERCYWVRLVFFVSLTLHWRPPPSATAWPSSGLPSRKTCQPSRCSRWCTARAWALQTTPLRQLFMRATRTSTYARHT